MADEFTIIKVEERDNPLCDIFSTVLKIRSKKTNRALGVSRREEDPIFEAIEMARIRYEYFVSFFKERAIAGNHYHLIKKEILCCLPGNPMTIYIMDPNKKIMEVIRIPDAIEDKTVTIRFVDKYGIYTERIPIMNLHEEIPLIHIHLGMAHAVCNNGNNGQIVNLIVFSDIAEHNPKDDHPYEVI